MLPREFTASTVAAIDGLAARADQLSTAAGTASAAVARAHERLRGIVDRFEARAQTLEPYLDSPGVAEQLMAEAQRSLDEAVAVVEELRAELDEHAAVVATPDTTRPRADCACRPDILRGACDGLGPGRRCRTDEPAVEWSVRLGVRRSRAADEAGRADAVPEAAAFGDGVAIRLPDGSIATAPNAVAASAVRHALTQLGVPYDWGGTTPGVGLDCSGLTQWAYSEAGLNLPRLAQEQDVGAAVAAGDLRPGDLAVWDGHVAMIVGNGQMVEAGDPMHLSPIRTTNAGQGFEGFWRPTA